MKSKLKQLNTYVDGIENYFTQKNQNLQSEFLAFFRISISAIALIDIFSMFADFKLFFSQSETIIPQELTFVFSPYFSYLNVFYQWLKTNELLSLYYNSVLSIYIIALFFLLTGFLTRFSACLALLLQLLIFKSFEEYNYGYDAFLTISLFYCFVFPTGKSFSLDYLIRKSRVSSFNYAKVLQIHLCFVYFFAGLPKMLDSSWWNGKSMWKALVSVYNDYQNIPSFLFVIAGITTILIEVSYPVLMHLNKFRKVTLALMIMMHIGIAVTMNLFIFASIMIAMNLAAWYHLLPATQHKHTLKAEPA